MTKSTARRATGCEERSPRRRAMRRDRHVLRPELERCEPRISLSTTASFAYYTPNSYSAPSFHIAPGPI